MIESSDLAEKLLAADPAERERLLRSAEPQALESALQVLGHQRSAAAAEVLALVDQVVADRAVRKAARRELHRLRSMGVEAPPPSSPAAASGPAPPATLEVAEAWGTEFDANGARALWLLAERPLGGVWFAALLLNDVRGLQEMNLVDTTRKRFQREIDHSRAGEGVWVSLPGDYTLRLVREAVDLTREVGGGLPTRYRAFREIFGEAPGPPERALIYETVSPVEINFNPGWLEDSARLLSEPELAGWHISVPAEMRARALEVARAPTAGLVVPGHTPEQQALQLLADASRQALTPLVRRALRRRLEETAYIFAQTDRLAMARLAAAAAQALADPNVHAERHPLLRALLAAGLGRLISGESVGVRRASDALVELIDRAGQQQAQAGPVETRPSGLILPR